MRKLVIVAMLTAFGCKQDSGSESPIGDDQLSEGAAAADPRSADDQIADTPEAEQSEKPAEVVPVPDGFDLSAVAGAERSAVERELAEWADDESEDSYELGPVSLSVDYRAGRAHKLQFMSEEIGTARISRELGIPSPGVHAIAGGEYLVRRDNVGSLAVVTVAHAELPQPPPPMRELLGRKEPGVRRILGEPQAGTIWHLDEIGVMLAFSFDDERTVRHVLIDLPDGIDARKRGAEVLRWLGLPDDGEELTVRGARYRVSVVDRYSVQAERRYGR